jgi:hypothetical protein
MKLNSTLGKAHWSKQTTTDGGSRYWGTLCISALAIVLVAVVPERVHFQDMLLRSTMSATRCMVVSARVREHKCTQWSFEKSGLFHYTCFAETWAVNASMFLDAPAAGPQAQQQTPAQPPSPASSSSSPPKPPGEAAGVAADAAAGASRAGGAGGAGAATGPATETTADGGAAGEAAGEAASEAAGEAAGKTADKAADAAGATLTGGRYGTGYDPHQTIPHMMYDHLKWVFGHLGEAWQEVTGHAAAATAATAAKLNSGWAESGDGLDNEFDASPPIMLDSSAVPQKKAGTSGEGAHGEGEGEAGARVHHPPPRPGHNGSATVLGVIHDLGLSEKEQERGTQHRSKAKRGRKLAKDGVDMLRPGMVGPCLVRHPFPWDIINLLDVLYMVDLTHDGRSDRSRLQWGIPPSPWVLIMSATLGGFILFTLMAWMTRTPWPQWLTMEGVQRQEAKRLQEMKKGKGDGASGGAARGAAGGAAGGAAAPPGGAGGNGKGLNDTSRSGLVHRQNNKKKKQRS